MTRTPAHHMRLYNQRDERLYLNASELERFICVAQNAPAQQRSFALTLAYTGVRLSEARMLLVDSVQFEERVLSVRTLKQRDKHVIREIPIPAALVAELKTHRRQRGEQIWHQCGRPIARITTYRWIKKMMADANITGAKASPKGLRHAYGAKAVLAGVPLHMLQLWMGHASMKTTAIYATVMSEEQMQLCDRMWGGHT